MVPVCAVFVSCIRICAVFGLCSYFASVCVVLVCWRGVVGNISPCLFWVDVMVYSCCVWY